MELRRIHRSDAVEDVGIGFQDVSAAVRRLHKPSFEWIDLRDVVRADEFPDRVVMLAGEPGVLLGIDDELPNPAPSYDQDASQQILFEEPAAPQASNETSLPQSPLKLLR